MKRFLMVVLCAIFCWGAYAQTNLPNSCSVSIPKLLDRDLLRDSDIQKFLNNSNWGQDDKANRYWAVYSDRSHNTTYKSPSDNAEKYDELFFNEEVRIAHIEGDYALVYTEKKVSVLYPKISSDAISRGWIPMKNLLLWNSCPIDDKGGLQNAWIVINLSSSSIPNDEDVGKLFMNPVTKDSPQKVFSDMKFYFVMKQGENGLLLLSKSPYLLHHESQLFGWVNKNSLIPCNQRVFLEPNWIPEEVERLKGKYAYVYNHDGKIAAAIPIGKQNGITEELTAKYRLEPGMMRFPILENMSGDNNHYHVMAFISSGLPDVPNTHRYSVFPKEEILVGFQGYVDKKDSITGLDYWKPVIYISNAEYDDLMNKLKPVMAAAEEGSEDRKPYIEAMKELVRTLYGNIEEKKMMLMDTKMIMSLIAGLNVKSEALNGRTLEQIQNNKVVSQGEFTAMISNFKEKYRKLDRIRNGYKYSVVIEGERWYWIPVQDLP